MTEPTAPPEQPILAPRSDETAQVECYCAKWLRQAYDIQIWGDADTIPANISRYEATVGDVVLFRYSNADHVALITGYGQTNWVILDKWPQDGNCIVRNISIPRDDKNIRGYFRPPKDSARPTL